MKRSRWYWIGEHVVQALMWAGILLLVSSPFIVFYLIGGTEK